jgi:hypothetical protein
MGDGQMKKFVFFQVIVALMFLAFLCNAAGAFERIPDKSGFSGFIRLGGGGSWAKSNMIAGNDLGDVGKKQIDSLTSSPDSESDAIPQFDFNLRYTFASVKTQIFLGSRVEDILRYDAIQQLAVRKRFTRAGILGAGFLFTALPTEVWEDPYVVDQNRKETDRDSMGVIFFWENILNTPFDVNYGYRKIELDDEKSGQTQLIGAPPPFGITASEAKLLDREGDSHSIRAVYTWKFGQRHVLSPALYFLYEDLDGDAMKNYTIDFQPTYAYVGTKFDLVLNAAIGFADYDEKNPIYGKTNSDTRFGLGGIGFWKNPFNWFPKLGDKFRFYANAFYFNSDADIDFYKTEIAQATVGVWIGW